jgi:peptide deformylase
MAILPIITAPDARLKQVSRPVEAVDDALRALMDDMLETMYAAPGIGLAAIQVGVAKNVIVIDLGKDDGMTEPLFLVNPEILATSEELATYNEGCLSVPEEYWEVKRPARCRVRYLDYHGKQQVLEAEGLLATCVQHEMDHLKGILFIDHLSSLKRNMILRRAGKARRLKAAE